MNIGLTEGNFLFDRLFVEEWNRRSPDAPIEIQFEIHQRLIFSLDIGVYFEKDSIIQNLRFKEIECQLRKVIVRQDSGTLRLISGNGDWREDLEMRYWLITENTDMEALLSSVRLGLGAC